MDPRFIPTREVTMKLPHCRLSLLLLVVVPPTACGFVEPKLQPVDVAVLVTVDQMRADLLYDHANLFQFGLKRLLDDGHRFVNGTHDHAETSTAPGHTTLATGVFPSRHGIVANTWSELVGDRWVSVYAVADSTSAIIGAEGLPGRSPRSIQRPGFGSWVKAADSAAHVLSISKKDRAAITTAGAVDGQVYWLGGAPSRFVSSAYYMDSLPSWVQDFNQNQLPGHFRTEWLSPIPVTLADSLRPDAFTGEGYWDNSTFPHNSQDVVGVYGSVPGNAESGLSYESWWLGGVPFPDAAVLGLVAAALAEFDLEGSGTTDYLSVALSQTDAIGHQFGPRSNEQLANLLHLDRVLGDLFDLLDSAIGGGRWVVALSADHGVLDLPEQVLQDGLGPGRFTDEMKAERSAFRALLGTSQGQVPDSALVPWWVAMVRSTDDLLAGAGLDSLDVLVSRSLFEGRALPRGARFGFQVRYMEGLLQAPMRTGTTHGSPYYYDRHVPIVFLGANVSAGVSELRASTVDVAPTLATLAGIPFPDDLDGKVLPVR